jgi:hypothetical protein
MKKIMFFSVFGFLILSYCATAQIKVYEDTRVKVFGDRPTDDANKDLSIQIYGNYGTYLANARLAFGAYTLGENFLYAQRVFVAELGNNILKLISFSGKHSIELLNN